MACEFLIIFLAYKIAARADKFSSGSAIGNETISNQQLTEELHKPIIRKF